MTTPQPWTRIPNPFRFEPLSEQIHSIHVLPARSPGALGIHPPKLPQRSSPVGRDWLGSGFEAGDILLDLRGEPLQVEEIFLDDSNGNPYLQYFGDLVLEKATGQILRVRREWHGPTMLRRVDMDWRGTHLGLVTRNEIPRGLDDRFIAVELQASKARCKPVAGGRRRSVDQARAWMADGARGGELYRLQTEARELPLIGDSFVYSSKS